MADYPSSIISNAALRPSLSKSLGNTVNSSTLNYTARFSSSSRLILGGINNQSLSKSRGQLSSNSLLLNVQSLAKLYFNNGFSQDSANIYLSKSSLGLPNGLNLSLEAFFVACLMQWAINTKSGDDQKITSQFLAYADKQGSYIYFTIEVSFKKLLTVVDDYELQVNYTLSPLDF
jgi:hypothetical protein